MYTDVQRLLPSVLDARVTIYYRVSDLFLTFSDISISPKRLADVWLIRQCVTAPLDTVKHVLTGLHVTVRLSVPPLHAYDITTTFVLISAWMTACSRKE